MSDPSFETAVLAQLAAIRDDAARSSDRHDAGLKKLFDIHEAHCADDAKRFDGISTDFTNIAIGAAEAKGEARVTAKIWGLCAGAGGALLAIIPEVWKYLHRQ